MTPSYFPVGTLVVDVNDPEFPYEVRAVDIRVTEKGATVLYCLLDPSCDKNTPCECGRTLYSSDVALYAKFKVGDLVVLKSTAKMAGREFGKIISHKNGMWEIMLTPGSYRYIYKESDMLPYIPTSPHYFQD
jgi:hypothetical protein